MSKRILLFPGQGSQYLGMGKKLAESHAGARKLLDEANATLGFDLADIMWNGPEEKLTSTDNTQPALFTVSMMAMEWLRERGMGFDFAAGHSLGEYSALCAAGVFSFADGLRLVRLRGELMSKAGEARPGAMSAILGLERDKLEEALKTASASGIVVAANFNSPSQIVISGERSGVEAAEKICAELGAKKVVRLPVSGAFHSPLMEYAVEGLRKGLDAVAFSAPKVPVISNVEAIEETNPEALKSGLLKQLYSPVRWVESMQRAQALGVSEGLEVGAGKVLMGLLRGISRDVKVTPVENPEDLA
jgi:[acyl-carrier-protein] S-malonyltransferase